MVIVHSYRLEGKAGTEKPDELLEQLDGLADSALLKNPLLVGAIKRRFI